MPRSAVFALFLSLMLPACGGSETTAPATESTAEPAAAEPAVDAPAGAEEEAPAKDQRDGALREGREESAVVRDIKPIDAKGTASPKKRTQLSMDTSKSSIDWVALKNGSVEIKGQFTALAGSLSIDPNDLRSASGEIGIDLLGIATGDDARDKNVAATFFGATGVVPLHGQVSVTGIQPEAKTIAVGETTRALAQTGIAVGADVVGLMLPIQIERLGKAHYKVTTLETLNIGIGELGLSERKAALMKLCAHESIGNTVTATSTAFFGEADPK